LSALNESYGSKFFRKAKILKSVELVLKTNNINHITRESYEFITSYCGSAAHYSINSWKRSYSDVRDFVNLFLKGNEYGVNLEKALKSKGSLGKGLPREESCIVKGIIELCKRHRREVFRALDTREKRRKEKIARAVLRGTLSLKDILGASPVTIGSPFPHHVDYAFEASGKSSIRELVEELNHRMDIMDIEGLKDLVRKYPKEAVIAGNYVNAKVRYVVQSIIASEVTQMKLDRNKEES
jgi:hypothetical protein